MFRGRIAMNPTCPVCGHAFEREPGFFQGAMYVSYGLGTLWLGVLGIAAHFVVVPVIGLAGAVVFIVAVHLASVPTMFRYSRVIWAHVNVGTLVR